MEILLIFGARSQALRSANMLRASAYRASVVSAPAGLGGSGSCALAVSTDGAGFAFFTRSARLFPSLRGAYSASGGKYARIF